MGDAKKKADQEEEQFTYKPMGHERGAGLYPLADAGLGRSVLEYAQVGGANKKDFDDQRKAAQEARKRGR